MTYNAGMAIFVETTHFTQHILKYFKDDEYRLLQQYLMEHPEAGDVIRGGGGVRKLRWSRPGTGKSGGVRIIYYWAKSLSHIYLLTVYSKSERENIDAATLARIVKSLEGIK